MSRNETTGTAKVSGLLNGMAPRQDISLDAQTSLHRSLRQVIESINDTLKVELDLEHIERGPAIRHNDHTDRPIKRSLLAYDR